MHKYAVIVAGGLGKRMGNPIPKQFMLLGNKPILYHTINTFLNSYDGIKIILVLPAEYLNAGKQLAENHFPNSPVQIAEGGETRFQSVKNGLALVENESIIFVHDGVRCLLTTDLIHRCYDLAVARGMAVPVITSKDSVRLLREESNEPFDRDKVMLVQTPQTFHSKIILPAYQIGYKSSFTDEATVVEAYGVKILLIEGEEDNIKITRPVDLLIAEKILEQRGGDSR